jgi:hypothetical protein
MHSYFLPLFGPLLLHHLVLAGLSELQEVVKHLVLVGLFALFAQVDFVLVLVFLVKICVDVHVEELLLAIVSVRLFVLELLDVLRFAFEGAHVVAFGGDAVLVVSGLVFALVV